MKREVQNAECRIAEGESACRFCILQFFILLMQILFTPWRYSYLTAPKSEQPRLHFLHRRGVGRSARDADAVPQRLTPWSCSTVIPTRTAI